ncbi:MAG TPA: WG repeat-containing protein [Bacteroidia bacterium]
MSCKSTTTPTLIEKNGLYGLISKDSIIPPLYNYIHYGYEKGIVKVDSNFYQGLFNSEGKRLTVAEYDYIGPFENNRAIVGVQGDGNFKYSQGLIGRDGKLIFKPQYGRIERKLNYYVVYDKNLRCALYDSNGRALTQFRFRKISPINDTLICIVNSQTLYGVIHIKGHIIVPCAYNDMEFTSFQYGLIKVQKHDHYGYIDIKNNVKIEIKYEELESFKEGLAWAKDSNKQVGYIDQTGKTIVPFEYSDINTNWNNRHFNHGLAPVSKGRKFCLINKNNQAICGYKYDQISNHQNGFYFEIGNGIDKTSNDYRTLEFGFIDSNGIEKKYLQPPVNLPKIEPLSTENVLSSYIGYKYLSNFNALISNQLTSLIEFAPGYKERNNYSEILVSFGILLTDYEPIYNREKFDFKYHLLHHLLSNDTFIDLFWKHYRNEYKSAFSSLDPYSKQLYKNAVSDLHQYIHHYDLKLMTKYFNDHAEEFAKLNPDGTYCEFRKLRAFLDRLIIKHKVMDIKTAMKWVDTIHTEMLKWD